MSRCRSEEELQRRLESERFLTETCLRANPKSYGAWHHRAWAMDAMPAPDWQRELALCTKFLHLDERNCKHAVSICERGAGRGDGGAALRSGLFSPRILRNRARAGKKSTAGKKKDTDISGI